MRRSSALLALAALAWSTRAGAPDSPPGPDAWRVLGPGGGGTMLRPAVSPHDPTFVVLGCDMTGAYLTRDQGRSWRMFNLGAPPSAFAFDPRDPKVLYAATAALWRSEDAGGTWSMVYPDPGRNTVVHAWTDHADFVVRTEDPSYLGSGRAVAIHAVAVDPTDSNHIVIAVSSADSPRPGAPASPTWLLGSADRGRSWKRVAELRNERVFAIQIGGAGAAGVVQAAAESGVYEGAAGQFRRHDAPAPGTLTSASFAREKGGAPILYVTTRVEGAAGAPRGGVHVSSDGGRTWRGANGTLLDAAIGIGEGEAWGGAKGSRPGLGPVAASAQRGEVAYLGLRGVRRSASGAKLNGIAKTVDGGRSWSIVHEETDRPSANLAGSWIEERAPSDGYSIWFDAPYDLAVAPTDPSVCFVTDLFRTYRTLDGGRRWAQVNSAPRGDDRWVSRGLDVTNAYGIHFDPHDARRVFISYTDIGLFRSEDAGQSWTSSIRGIPLPWRNTSYWVAFDPEVAGLMWGAFSAVHDLPRPKMWRHRDPDGYAGGVGVSSDGGRSWTRAGKGMPESATTHVLLDPASPKGRRTLYACAFGRGVFKSTDNGETWSPKNAGILERQPFAWRITRAGDGMLYLVVSRRSERGEIGDPGDGALYRSSDGAEHWTRLKLPAGVNGPNGLAVDARDPSRLYLAAWGRATPGGDSGGGIFLSRDRGASWRNVLDAYQHVYDVTVDPSQPETLYAAGFDSSALRSTDRGLSWTRIRGFDFKWGHRVIPDPQDAARIYVTTFGGGVWHGPAAGDPDALESVVPFGRFRSGGHEGAPVDTSRLEQLVEANIRGIHAYQIQLARQQGRGDPDCWPRSAPSDTALEALGAHQTALLAADIAAVKAWAAGEASSFDPAQDLEPLLRADLAIGERLPVGVFTSYLAQHAPGRSRLERRVVANLYQTVLEVERDGDRLQDLFRFYIGLGLPVYVGQLGLPGSDADFLEVGRALESRACPSPVGLSAAEWQIAGRKIWNWGEKNQHIRDARVLADELLEEPAVSELIPRMRALPAQRVAIIGHSFTMDLHWSSPSAFVPTVTAILARENPKLEFRQFEGGGLTYSRGYKFYDELLAWKPDTVLIVALARTDADLDALGKLGQGFKAAGIRGFVFDDVHDPDSSDAARLEREHEAARAAGFTIVEVARLLATAPDRKQFLCLDGIHMTEPYHRLMAREWLKLLVGARGARLSE